MAMPQVTRVTGLERYLSVSIPSVTLAGTTLLANDELRYFYPTWRMLRDCYDGELQIKSKGQVYLRKLSAHSDAEYDAYLARGYFYNAVERTHKGLMGSIFRRRPEVRLPASLANALDLDDITKDGLSLRESIRTTASEVLLVGRHGILADLPEQDNSPIPRPFLAHYEAEAIYAYRRTVYRSRRIVDRVVLLENVAELTEYGTNVKPIFRVLRLDPDPDFAGELLYSQEVHDSSLIGPEAVRRVEVRPNGRRIRTIPFVFFGPNDLLPRIQASPLLQIATLNLSHYESTALLEHGRFYAGMPTYYIAGEGTSDLMAPGQEQQWTVGPSNVWQLAAGDKAGLLEFNGHGLSFLENAVDSKQLQMQSLGGRMIPSQQKAAALSTEAYALMEQGDEATLLDVVLTLERGYTQLMLHLGELSNTDVTRENVEIAINKEFVRSELTAREIRALQTLYERNVIPLDVLYYSLLQVGVIPQEYTLEGFTALLQRKDQQYDDPNLVLERQKLDEQKKAREQAASQAALDREAANRAPTPKPGV